MKKINQMFCFLFGGMFNFVSNMSWLSFGTSFIVDDDESGGSDDHDKSEQDGSEPDKSESEEDTIDYDSIIEKKTAKGIIKELEAKTKKNKELAKELESLKLKYSKKDDSDSEPAPKNNQLQTGKYPPQLQKIYDKCVKRGVDKEFMEDIFEAIGLTSSAISINTIKASQKQKDAIKATLRHLKSDDSGFSYVMSKFGDDVEQAIRKRPAKDWDDLELAESIASRIAIKHNLLSKEKGNIDTDSPTDPDSGSAKGGSGVNDKELRSFALSNGLSISTPEMRRKVAGIMLKRKKYNEKVAKDESNQ